jgi:hypothetical protein
MIDSHHTSRTGSLPAAAQAYMDELEMSLEGADRVEGDEVLTSIREHLDEQLAVLGHRPTPADVNEILSRLGSVDQVLATVEYQAPVQSRDSLSGWAVWLPRSAVVAGWLSLVLLVINPFVALPLAVLAVVTGLVGMRAHDTHRRVYVVALVLGLLGLLAPVVVVALLGGAGPSPTITHSPARIVSPNP